MPRINCYIIYLIYLWNKSAWRLLFHPRVRSSLSAGQHDRRFESTGGKKCVVSLVRYVEAPRRLPQVNRREVKEGKQEARKAGLLEEQRGEEGRTMGWTEVYRKVWMKILFMYHRDSRK